MRLDVLVVALGMLLGRKGSTLNLVPWLTVRLSKLTVRSNGMGCELLTPHRWQGVWSAVGLGVRLAYEGLGSVG